MKLLFSLPQSWAIDGCRRYPYASKIGYTSQDEEEDLDEDPENSDLYLNVNPLLLSSPHISPTFRLLESGSVLSDPGESWATEEPCCATQSPVHHAAIHCLICHNIFSSLPSLKAHLLLDHKILKTQLEPLIDLTLANIQQLSSPSQYKDKKCDDSPCGEDSPAPPLCDNIDLIMEWTRLDMNEECLEPAVLRSNELPLEYHQTLLTSTPQCSTTATDSLECSLVPTVEPLDPVTSTDELIQDLTDEDLYAVSKDIDLELGCNDLPHSYFLLNDQTPPAFYDQLPNVNSTLLQTPSKGWFEDY